MVRAVVIVALVTGVAWLALLFVLVLARPDGIDLAEAKRFVPDVVRFVGRLARDPSLGRGVRVRLVLLVGYLALPFDLVPDFVPVLGWADDVIVVAVALRSVVRHAGADALDRHWDGTASGLQVVRRLAGLPTR